ncbi:MAG TPA: hypothetical protein PLH44_00090 [Bacilli bacterium]|jgi:hypothetical protein|nr:hypothetical protein [Bacilli bacterium]NLT01570.1 hypothetical protein [Acholeplasmataceae bacterium]HOE06166.1 hypothetical protein [Bacilli bacterium]HOR17363.1 hypothetical protein [Bacilli bacterium]HPL54908.1 hypothetical protein [Bacilli bacterium]
MLKKLFAGNSLLSSLIALVASILMMAAVGFAWWTLSNQSRTDTFVTTVGNLEIDYTFKQFNDGNISGPLVTTADVDFANTIPGDTYSYVIVVENTGNRDGLSSVYMYGINSLVYDEIEGWIVLDSENPTRIQNSFNFEVLSIEYLTDTDDETLEQIFATLSSNNSKTYFTQGVDRYFLMENEVLTSEGAQSIIGIFFNITYEGENFDNNQFINQRFDINKIVIECR